jgi:hypothetical protein
MNPFILWVPGVALIVIAALLLALNRIEMVPALIAMGVGATIESIGVLIWIRERRGRDSR